jgi:hypothetical protein
MSALGQKRRNHLAPKSTFVRYVPKADKRGHNWIVRLVAEADIREMMREQRDRLAAVSPKSDQPAPRCSVLRAGAEI